MLALIARRRRNPSILKPGNFTRFAGIRVGLDIIERSPGSTVEVFELARVERPNECAETERAQCQCRWNEPRESCHLCSMSNLRPRSRTAFVVTAIDDADMAMAAMSGVTIPAIAIGMKTTL